MTHTSLKISSFFQQRVWLVLAVLATAVTHLPAQYFGQNKPRYERFDWTTYQTPHFSIYNYLERPAATDRVNPRLVWIGQLSESWYAQHSRVLDKDLPDRNLMLLYNNHADFQQTNAIQGSIATGERARCAYRGALLCPGDQC